MRALPSALFVSCLLVGLARPSPAEPADPSAELGGINASLVQLNATVAELAALMKRHLEQQDLALAMKRVELSTFLLVEANNQMNGTKQMRDSMKDSLDRAEESFQEISDEMPSGQPEPSAEEKEQMKQMLAHMEREMLREKEQLKRMDLQLIEHENQAAAHREDIVRWQEVVDAYYAARK